MARFLTTLIVLVLLPVAGHAADFYVNGATGNDNNSCNHADQACKTIKAALDKAPVGHHTIRVTRGVYTEDKMTIPGHRFITIKGGYDSSFSPRICGANPSTIIQTGEPGGDNQNWLTLDIQGQGNEASLELDCLELHNKPINSESFYKGIVVHTQFDAKAWFSMHHVLISGFRRTALAMDSRFGSTLSVNIDNSLFANNYAHYIDREHPLIIVSNYAGHTKVTFNKVSIKDYNEERCYTIEILTFKDGKTDFYLKNSILATDGSTRVSLFVNSPSGEENTSFCQITLINTTIYNYFGWAAEFLAASRSTISVQETNSILYSINCGQTIHAFDSAILTFASSYSILSPRGPDIYGSGVSFTSTNEVHGDPMLDSRYHLKKGSPAIDAGICGEYVPTPTFHYERIAPYDDIDGDKRPGDGKIFGCDIGADEYKAFPWPMFLPAIIHQRLNPYTIPTTPHF